MPTLNWIGKEKVVNHHLEVPYRVLVHKYTFRAAGNNGECPIGPSGNMIIHGDNLEALKALLPEYEGRVKCIYIDPPYNTGNEGWVYNGPLPYAGNFLINRRLPFPNNLAVHSLPDSSVPHPDNNLPVISNQLDTHFRGKCDLAK